MTFYLYCHRIDSVVKVRSVHPCTRGSVSGETDTDEGWQLSRLPELISGSLLCLRVCGQISFFVHRPVGNKNRLAHDQAILPAVWRGVRLALRREVRVHGRDHFSPEVLT